MTEPRPAGGTTEGRRVDARHSGDWKSIGALHGSARGERNITKRIAAMSGLAPLTGSTLLDVGCGTGEYTTAMASGFGHVDAIDIEEDRLAVFRANVPNNVTTSCQSVHTLNFKSDSFDRVTMIEVLEHIDDIPRALKEVARVLRPDGTLLITTPNRLWPFEQHGVSIQGRRLPGYALPGLTWVKPLHKRLSNSGAFTRRDLEHLADESGLQVQGVTYMMPPLDSLQAGHPLHRQADRIESTPLRHFGQTIIAGFTRLARPPADPAS